MSSTWKTEIKFVPTQIELDSDELQNIISESKWVFSGEVGVEDGSVRHCVDTKIRIFFQKISKVFPNGQG